jgi:diguanylate cyclase (GGDEF)-like protein
MKQSPAVPLINHQGRESSDQEMPQPGDVSQPQPSAEDSFLDLLVETLTALDETVRGQFLRQYFRTIAQIELTDVQSNQHWEKILDRHRELSESLGRKVSLKTAIIDVLASANVLRVPVIMEYDELKKLQVNAATDPLTGLHNRRFFDEACEKELNRAKRYGHTLAFVLLDLHKLKEVNDQRGHLEGDRILQLAATTLRKTLRASDTAFRIGGDEFALLLPQTDPEQATTLCRRVRSQYETELRPLRLGVGVTLDFGVAVHPQDGDQQRALLSLADERLYALKHAGRASPRVVPLEMYPREAAAAASTSKTSSGPVAEPASERAGERVSARAPEQRKWERVSLAGTKAHAVLTEIGQKTARVLDLSYGGVALLLNEGDEVPEQFNAVLNVPILPPVRVVLRRTYVLPAEHGRNRVGCSFVS